MDFDKIKIKEYCCGPNGDLQIGALCQCGEVLMRTTKWNNKYKTYIYKCPQCNHKITFPNNYNNITLKEIENNSDYRGWSYG